MNKKSVDHIIFDIESWYQQPLGKKIACLEQRQLNLLPPFVWGRSILYIGTTLNHSAVINTHVIIVKNKSPITNTLYHLQSNYNALPFSTNSFDTIILPHILETAQNPKKIVLESWRTLASEGHLIILGFNPFSLTHLSCLFDKTKLAFPVATRFHSISKLLHWLRNDYYEIISTRNFAYHSLTHDQHTLKHSTATEKLATWLLPACGSLYLLVLKKRTLPLTPMRLREQWRELFSNKNLLDPATGTMHHE